MVSVASESMTGNSLVHCDLQNLNSEGLFSRSYHQTCKTVSTRFRYRHERGATLCLNALHLLRNSVFFSDRCAAWRL